MNNKCIPVLLSIILFFGHMPLQAFNSHRLNWWHVGAICTTFAAGLATYLLWSYSKKTVVNPKQRHAQSADENQSAKLNQSDQALEQLVLTNPPSLEGGSHPLYLFFNEHSVRPMHERPNPDLQILANQPNSPFIRCANPQERTKLPLFAFPLAHGDPRMLHCLISARAFLSIPFGQQQKNVLATFINTRQDNDDGENAIDNTVKIMDEISESPLMGFSCLMYMTDDDAKKQQHKECVHLLILNGVKYHEDAEILKDDTFADLDMILREGKQKKQDQDQRHQKLLGK